jgi:hypothetical protein
MAEGRGAKPTTDEAGGWAGEKVNRSRNQIAGKRIGDPGQGFGFWINFLRGGQEKKTTPAILGVLLGQPDGASTLNHKNPFGHASRFGARFLGRGKFLFRRANGMKGALSAERVFWKADESSELHECLIVCSRIFLWNHGAGEFF